MIDLFAPPTDQEIRERRLNCKHEWHLVYSGEKPQLGQGVLKVEFRICSKCKITEFTDMFHDSTGKLVGKEVYVGKAHFSEIDI